MLLPSIYEILENDIYFSFRGIWWISVLFLVPLNKAVGKPTREKKCRNVYCSEGYLISFESRSIHQQNIFKWHGNLIAYNFHVCLSVQFSSVSHSCPILCDPMNLRTPGLPAHHQLPEFTQTHVHRVSDAIQPSHPLSSPSPPAPNPSQHQSLFQWVNSSHEVAKGLEFQL